MGLIPGWGRFPGGGNGNTLLANPMERSLVGYSPWGHKELDTTEQLSMHLDDLSPDVYFSFTKSGESL